jgi:hypothetical protein
MLSQKRPLILIIVIRRKPESSLFNMIHNLWTPAFAGVTTLCKATIIDFVLFLSVCVRGKKRFYPDSFQLFPLLSSGFAGLGV